VAHIVIVRPDQHKHLGVAWQNTVERVVGFAANGRGRKPADDAKLEREVGNVTAAVDRWGEAMALTLRSPRALSRSGRDPQEVHHG